jgi:hypothetical protein
MLPIFGPGRSSRGGCAFIEVVVSGFRCTVVYAGAMTTIEKVDVKGRAL